MDTASHLGLAVRQEHFALQAHFQAPVFDLFVDLPALSRHFFHTLGSYYDLRLTNMRFETGAGGLGEVFLRITWPALAEVRVFLDRAEIESGFPQFLRSEARDLVADVLSTLAEHVRDTPVRTYSVTQEVHGELRGQSRQEFLAGFVPSVPEGLGPPLGSGVVFYFGAEADRLAAAVTLDFSRPVEGGIFVRSTVLYDASKVQVRALQALARSQFESLLRRVGLEE